MEALEGDYLPIHCMTPGCDWRWRGDHELLSSENTDSDRGWAIRIVAELGLAHGDSTSEQVGDRIQRLIPLVRKMIHQGRTEASSQYQVDGSIPRKGLDV
jgi:hypothetical protein